MTDEERDIMNRLHAEEERRSNDFGHRTIVEERALKCPPQYTAREKNLSKKGRQGQRDLRIPHIHFQSQPIDLAVCLVASGRLQWVRWASFAPGRCSQSLISLGF